MEITDKLTLKQSKIKPETPAHINLMQMLLTKQNYLQRFRKYIIKMTTILLNFGKEQDHNINVADLKHYKENYTQIFN